MKNYILPLTLFASLLAGTSAQAAKRVDTEGFSLILDHVSGYRNYPRVDMQILSSNSQTVEISLNGFGPVGASTLPGLFNLDFIEAGFSGYVNSGYRINSISMRATFQGMSYAQTEPNADWANCNDCDRQYVTLAPQAQLAQYQEL